MTFVIIILRSHKRQVATNISYYYIHFVLLIRAFRKYYNQETYINNYEYVYKNTMNTLNFDFQ